MLKSPRSMSGVPFVVVEVAKGTWRTVDHHNVELDRKGDSDSVEFKCRSDQVLQWKDLVGPLQRDEESSPSSSA